MAARKPPQALRSAKEAFLARWGAMGPEWGINRTMSQIHALLMVSPESLNTDQIMDALEISRGNAHGNIKELCSWGLLRKLPRKGDRKDYYEAEKDVWTVVQLIARERRRKEIEPVLATLAECLESTRGLRDAESLAFRRQLKELQRFASLGDRVAEQVVRRKPGKILPWILKFLGPRS